jgi:hypothetical protein
MQGGDYVVNCCMRGGSYIGLSFNVHLAKDLPAHPFLGHMVAEDIYVRLEKDFRPGTCQFFHVGVMSPQDADKPPLEVPAPLLKEGEWFDLKVEVRRRRFTVWINDCAVPILDLERSASTSDGGFVGVRSWGGEFTNFQITRETGAKRNVPAGSVAP